MTTSPPRISRLTYVPLREAWRDEARDFTPWLADNIAHISDVLGIDLELTDTEVAVDSYSADILAQDTETGDRVLIENQLERSDHRHLGQIMTYLAGLDARTVIWIAPGFSASHLSSLKWLNENTPDDMAFFALSLNLARIGDSDYAPVFEVQTRPDTWERTLSAKADNAEAERTALRTAFWQRYATRHPGAITPTRASNVWVPMREDGALVLSMFVASQRCGVFLRGAGGADVAIINNFMLAHGEKLARHLGIDLSPNPDAGRYVVDRITIPLADRARWDEIIAWMEDRRTAYQAAIAAL